MKDNRTFTLILVVVIGVLIGLAIISKQTKSPIFKVIYDQQIAMLKSQDTLNKSMDRILEYADDDNDDDDDDDDDYLTRIFTKQNMLESRISILERQVKALNKSGANKPSRPSPPPEDFTKVYDIPVSHSPVIGNQKAIVTLVEFIDVQCSYCSRFHTPLVEAVKAYPGKVNYMIKNFPLNFHPHARSAAKAAFAAGEQGKYAEMMDLLLKNAKQLSEEKYSELAGQLGLNVKKFNKDLKEKDVQWESYIQADMALATKVGVRGTPTFFINGRKTRARDLGAFKKAIEEILNKK